MMQKQKERQIITIDYESTLVLFEVLEQEPKCHFCGTMITKENFGAIFNTPTQVSCNSLLCLIELIDEEKAKEKWVYKKELK